MAKRSRKLSTRRPRRSKSSTRKTMKKTKRQPSKKRTLKKRKSRTKSVRKRKKTKKVMKGGMFGDKGGIKVKDFITYFNKSGSRRTITILEKKKIPTKIPTEIITNMENIKTMYIQNPTPKQYKYAQMTSNPKDPVQYLMFLTDNAKIIGVLISSYRDEVIVKVDKKRKLEKEEIQSFINNNIIISGATFSKVLPHEPAASASAPLSAAPAAARAASASAPAATSAVDGGIYRPIYEPLPLKYKVSDIKSDGMNGNYHDLTLLDGENDGDGTTVKIVIDSNTDTMSISDFKDFSPTTTSISSFKSLEAMFDYYKKQKFIYTKGTVRSPAVLLGSKID